MLQNLEDTNPSAEWLRQQFQAKLDLIGGKQIVIRFDMYIQADMFDAEKVIEECGDSILADIEKDYGEFLSVASTIATVLNQKMNIVASAVIDQCALSREIVFALVQEDYRKAAVLADNLIVSLLIFEPQASKVWTEWIDKVYIFIDSRDLPGSFGM